MYNCKKILTATGILFCLTGTLYSKQREVGSFFIRNNSSTLVYFAMSSVEENPYGVIFYKNGEWFITEYGLGIHNLPMPPVTSLEPGSILRIFDTDTGTIEALEMFKSFIGEFYVYDTEGYLFLTINDLQEGTIVEYDLDSSGNRIVHSIQERAGNIMIEFLRAEPPLRRIWYPEFTIEITDEIIARGREKYSQLPIKPVAEIFRE